MFYVDSKMENAKRFKVPSLWLNCLKAFIFRTNGSKDPAILRLNETAKAVNAAAKALRKAKSQEEHELLLKAYGEALKRSQEAFAAFNKEEKKPNEVVDLAEKLTPKRPGKFMYRHDEKVLENISYLVKKSNRVKKDFSQASNMEEKRELVKDNAVYVSLIQREAQKLGKGKR